MKAIPFFLFTLLFILHNLTAQRSPTDTVGFEQRVDQVFTDFDDPTAPGATVAVHHKGKLVFAKGYGSANLEYDIPNTPTTVFHVASVSKQFTAFSVLLLESQGKLSLEDDIRKYIPEVPDFGSTITLRHLASHTSGMRDQWVLLAMAGWRLDDVITKEHVLKLVERQRDLNFQPGEEYLYCNTGFTLLAEVVARVSGQSFAEFTQENIFRPLGMTKTLFYDDHEKIVKNRAYSYYAGKEGYRKSVLSYANVGATSLFTTVVDLLKWTDNFAALTVGTKEMVNKMNTLQTLNNGSTFGGGLGQFIDQYRGLDRIQHGGSDAAYRTYLARFPAQDFSVAVFSNRGSANPPQLANAVTDIFLEGNFPDQAQVNVSSGERPTPVKLPNKQLKKFTGEYWNDAENYGRRIYLRKDTLRYFRGEGNESPLVPIGENVFSMLGVDVDLRTSFVDANGKKRMIVTIDNGFPMFFDTYDPPSYSSEDLEQFTGRFHSDELATDYTFAVRGDQIVAQHPRHADILFRAVKNDVFISDRWFFGNLRFERDERGQISGLSVDSGRIRHLKFTKK